MINLSLIDLKILLCFVFSAGITLFLIPSIVEMSNLKSLVAVPNKRTSHDEAVPNLGGIAIYIGIIISYLLFLKTNSFPKFQYMIASSMIIFFVGFKDDITGLNPFKKFFGQFLATYIIISFGGVRLTNLYGFFGITNIDYSLSYLLTIITIIGITNCFNLMDGIDGLSSGLGIVACLFFGSWFYFVGDYDWAVLTVAMMGSLVSFGYFNVFGHKNKLFMGDTGSLTIGFMMAVVAVHFNQKNLEHVLLPMNSAPAVSIGFLMIPLFDTLRVFFTRLLKRTSPFHPDRTHIHHYLLNLGFSHKKATLFLILTAFLFGIISFLLRDLKIELLIIILFLLASGLTFFLMHKANKVAQQPVREEVQ